MMMPHHENSSKTKGLVTQISEVNIMIFEARIVIL